MTVFAVISKIGAWGVLLLIALVGLSGCSPTQTAEDGGPEATQAANQGEDEGGTEEDEDEDEDS